MTGRPDRHQPLPGILGLPGFLYRKLSPRGRRVFQVAAVLSMAGLAALAVVLVPEIRDHKRSTAEQNRREAARNLEQRRREMAAEQRPQTGATASGALEAALGDAIVADVAQRVRAGWEETRAKRTECERLPPAKRGGRTLRAYSCTAVTSVIPGSEGSSAGFIGYPYRALADPRTGEFTFCKVAGRPGEGSYTRRAAVRLPRACGG